MDIKKQLSQSLQVNAGAHGGISKPHSRRNSIARIRSNDASDNDDNDDEDDDQQGNERKRRDNINDRIQELLSLVPADFFNDIGGNNANLNEEEAMMRNSGTKDGKPNKGQILTKSVEYIQHLQNLIDENNRKEVELRLKVQKLQGTKDTLGHTSAEYALGKIGVGPESTEYFKDVLLSSTNASKSRR